MIKCNKSVVCVTLTNLKEKVHKIWVLLQFGTDYTKELNLFIFCRSSQHLPTQTHQFLTAAAGKK